MKEQASPFTVLSEAQQMQALQLFALSPPDLEVGLAKDARSDRGKRRGLALDGVSLIEGMALQTPPRSMASMHRQNTAIALEQGWKPPSYGGI